MKRLSMFLSALLLGATFALPAVAETTLADQEESGFEETVSDASLTASVKAQLLANDEVGGMDINVDTQDGVVTLSGTVTSDAESELAERIAGGVDGVLEVRNRLTVAGDE